MNMAEYISCWLLAAGAAEECQYLNFEEDLKMILFNISKIQLQKKKKG